MKLFRNMKGEALVVWVCLAVGLLAANHAVAAPTLTVGSGVGEPDDSVPIGLTFTNPANNVVAFSFDITFDGTALTPDVSACGGANASVAPGDVTCTVPNSNAVRVLVFPNDTNDPLSDGSLGSISFLIADDAALAGTIESLNITDPLFSDDAEQSVAPAQNGLTDGQISIQAGDPTLSFNFEGDPAPAPGPLNIGTVELIGSTNGTLQVCNSGAVGSVIDNITAEITSNTDDFSVDTTNCDAASLVGAATPVCCDLDITFGPGDAPANGRVGEITVGASVGGTATSTAFNLTGTYTAGPAANLTIDLTSFDFGGVNVDDSPTATFTIENEGPANSEAEITANPSAAGGEFSVTGGDCSDGTTLASGVSCQVIVEFAPTSAGPQTGTLTVSGRDSLNDVALSPPLTADLEGVGNGSIFNVTPRLSNNLGTTTPGGELGPLDVLISNTGNEALTLDCGDFQGDVDEFDVVPDSLAGNETTVEADGGFGFAVSCEVPEQATYSISQTCTTNEPTPQDVTFEFSCSAQPLVVPTMQNWGLILMALMMLLVGGISIRFFRT